MACQDTFLAHRLRLVKMTRALEAAADRERTVHQKMTELWPAILAASGDDKASASSSSSSCAAEESILRWLLKQMDGATPDAERVRRLPLTWTILGCLLGRVSLFRLSKTFLERGFIALLRQAAKDISRPQKKDGAGDDVPEPDRTSRKRKREPAETALGCDVEHLRSAEACFESAVELFAALDQLLARLAVVGPSPGLDLVGAEHVKALFRLPAKEAQELVAPLLVICVRSLDGLEDSRAGRQGRWVQIVRHMWDLHLGSKEDASEFALHLYAPSAAALSRLQGVAGAITTEGRASVREIWRQQLEQLVMKSLINPSRTLFSSDKKLVVLEVAAEAGRRQVAASCQILWRLAVKARHSSDDAASRKEDTEWVQTVFAWLMRCLRDAELTDSSVVCRMLDTAIRSGSSPDSQTLADLCVEYGLLQDRTDWEVIIRVIQLDSDVMLSRKDMLGSVLKRVTSSSHQVKTEADTLVSGVINPLMQAFVRARDLAGFVQKWTEQLLELERQGGSRALAEVVWLDGRIRQEFSGVMQTALSKKQLISLVEWVASRDGVCVATRLVLLNAVCCGICHDDFVDAVGTRLFEAAFQTEPKAALTSEVLAMKWHIAGMTASWATADQADLIWDRIQDGLGETLTAAPLPDAATLHAFLCCCQLWLATFPGGSFEADVSKMTAAFLTRLVHEAQREVAGLAGLAPLVDVVFTRLPRLAGSSRAPSGLWELISSLFRLCPADMEGERLREKLVSNEDLADDEDAMRLLISPVIDHLVGSQTTGCGWTGPESIGTMSTLLRFPVHALFKEHRKRIMVSWKKWRRPIAEKAAADATYAAVLWRLLMVVMKQPGLSAATSFGDVWDLAMDTQHGTAAEGNAVVERVAGLAVRHVLTGRQEWSLAYVDQVNAFAHLDPAQAEARHLALLKGLWRTLTSCTAQDRDLLSFQDQVAQKLLQIVLQKVTSFARTWRKAQRMENQTEQQKLIDTLEVALDAADSLKDRAGSVPAPDLLDKKTLQRLAAASDALAARGLDHGWRLATFLRRHSHQDLDAAGLAAQLQESRSRPGEHLVFAFVDAAVQGQGPTQRLEVLRLLACSASVASTAALAAIQRLIETSNFAVDKARATTSLSVPSPSAGLGFDVAALHNALARLLPVTGSLAQFRSISTSLLLLLDQHASLMSQMSIEMTLATVSRVCSTSGPALGPTSGGAVFVHLFQLVAVILKRHRRRMEGRHHLLVSVLHILLRVLLTDPASTSRTAPRPPWLTAGLQARHAARFSRLLTLVCEPSAASVARSWQSTALDAPTDAAKRAAGQHMYHLLALYIKIQLDVAVPVPRDIRKALEPGMYSLLTITPEAKMKILNESMDDSGRAILRNMYADYKRFGKWTGI